MDKDLGIRSQFSLPLSSAEFDLMQRHLPSIVPSEDRFPGRARVQGLKVPARTRQAALTQPDSQSINQKMDGLRPMP